MKSSCSFAVLFFARLTSAGLLLLLFLTGTGGRGEV